MSVDNFEKYIHKQVVLAQYVSVMDFYHEQALNMCTIFESNCTATTFFNKGLLNFNTYLFLYNKL